MSGMLQQAKQVQEKIEELQSELAALRIEGRAGGGLVTATVNGQQELLTIRLDESLPREDLELVEDLIVAAVGQALKKSREESQNKMNSLTGGMLGGLNGP
jgi:hypothetical protein